MKYVLIWYDRKSERQEYHTTANSAVEAQANFGQFQAKKKLHTRWKEIYQVINRKRIKI